MQTLRGGQWSIPVSLGRSDPHRREEQKGVGELRKKGGSSALGAHATLQSGLSIKWDQSILLTATHNLFKHGNHVHCSPLGRPS